MFQSYYKLEISGKDIKRFLRFLMKKNLNFEEIELKEKLCYVKVDKASYEKIMDIKTSYSITVLKVYGFKKFEYFIKKNIVFIASCFLGIFTLFLLSHLIFEVEVVHNDKNIRDLLYQELEKYDLKKYSLSKSYEYIQEVKEKILKDNKENIEWLEIEKTGTTYRIRVEKRIMNDLSQEEKNKHIVAKKPGIIMKIVAEKGEIVKKINDYVKEGDIIISGNIYRNGEVIDHISASGDVFAEVWYKVKVEMPISYHEEKETGRKKYLFNIQFLNKSINLFDFHPYRDKKVEGTVLFHDFFNLFQIRYHKEIELEVKDEVNDIISEEFAFKVAREKIEKNLKTGEYIISQKKLKTVINNSTIVTEIFFKVYENISSPEYYSIEEGQ